MSTADILSKVSRYYAARLSEHGPTPQGVDWNSPESQALRFDQLLKVVKNPDERFSILDYGCGYGALLDYMEAKRFAFDYTGLDCAESMLDAARKAHGKKENVQFTRTLQEMAPFDYAVASGVLNVKQDVPEGQWKHYVLDTLDTLARTSRRGFAVNALTRYSDSDKTRTDLHYADPLALFDYCKTHLSKHVTLLHDYPLYEFTLLVRNDEH